MAVREFNIPFGPDQTGGLGLAAFEEETETDEVMDPFSEPPADAYAHEMSKLRAGLPSDPTMDDLTDVPESLSASETGKIALVDEEVEVAPRAKAPTPRKRGGGRTKAPRSESRDGAPAEDAHRRKGSRAARDHDGNDVQTSFSALKSSFEQSRELKMRQRELQEFSAQLESDKEELADRQHILQDYEQLVSEQDDIIEHKTREREDLKEELASIVEEMDAIEAELSEMHEYHQEQLHPLEAELGRAKANADQAKNDERSRKSELGAAETEMRRSGAGNESAMAMARYDQIREAYDRACAISADAQEALAEIQRTYDDALDRIDQAEGPLKRSLEDLGHHEDELKDRINELGDEISVARKRRQYCDTVHMYPDETKKLAKTVGEDEETLRYMQEDHDALAETLAYSKATARKAKVALVLAAIIVIVLIIAIVLLASRF